MIVPAMGERLMCTSKGERKMLMTVGEFGRRGRAGVRASRARRGRDYDPASGGEVRCGRGKSMPESGQREQD